MIFSCLSYFYLQAQRLLMEAQDEVGAAALWGVSSFRVLLCTAFLSRNIRISPQNWQESVHGKAGLSLSETKKRRRLA